MHLVCHVYYFQLPYRYFTTCHLLSENTSPAERLEWDRRYMEGNEMEKSKTLVICDTGKIIISCVAFFWFMCQLFHEFSLWMLF